MIPNYQALMPMVLTLASEKELSVKEAVQEIAEKLELTGEERRRTISSGATLIASRVGWAKTYLVRAKLLNMTARGRFVITDRGREALRSGATINNQYLKQYDEFCDFVGRKSDTPTIGKSRVDLLVETDTPEEVLRNAYLKITNAVSADLMHRVRSANPFFFEKMIIDLLLAMGYGGSHEDAGKAIGQKGDDGVDGVINQDPLGTDQIYIQAKRYAAGNNVGAGAIRDFFGSLNLKKAQKGIFFTTSNFTADAIRTAKELNAKIVLIDAEKLADLMIRFNIGCRDEDVIRLKRVDEEYFEE